MLKEIFKKFEDPSRPLLGPNIKALKFWGLLLPDNSPMKYLYLFFHFAIVILVFLQCIEVWVQKSDIKMCLDNIKFIIFAFVSIFKVFSFISWQKDWHSIIDYVTVTDIEHRKTTDGNKLAIIDKLTRYCRKVTYFYVCFLFSTISLELLLPIFKFVTSSTYRHNARYGIEQYQHIVHFWVPFDNKTPMGYLLSLAYESYAGFYASGWITSFDTTIITIMMFFKGELELLRLDSSQIFGSENDPVTDEESLRRIKACHNRHVLLMRYVSLFNKCLSPVMFFYLLVCSMVICVTAYQINIETAMGQIIISVEYLAFNVAQLFLFCWHANDVYNVSTYLVYGPYESLWWCRNVKLRRNIHILSGQFKTVVKFSAGPFTNLTLSTFINIMKGAYSYYTLLNPSKD